MNPNDYEPSDETTDDLATAVGWGVFYEDTISGRWLTYLSDRPPFRTLTVHSTATTPAPVATSEFHPPFTRAKLKAPEPRPGDVELRRWCMETGRVVKGPSVSLRWNQADLAWEYSWRGWIPDDGPRQDVLYTPADGKPW